MGRHHGDVDSLASGEGYGFAVGLELLIPRKFAASAGVVSLVNAVWREPRITGLEHSHHFVSAQLEKDIVLGIEVIRGDCVGA